MKEHELPDAIGEAYMEGLMDAREDAEILVEGVKTALKNLNARYPLPLTAKSILEQSLQAYDEALKVKGGEKK